MSGYKLQKKNHSTQTEEIDDLLPVYFSWGCNQNSFVKVLIVNGIIKIKDWKKYNYWCVATDCFEATEEELFNIGISWYKIYDITIIYTETDDLGEFLTFDII